MAGLERQCVCVGGGGRGQHTATQGQVKEGWQVLNTRGQPREGHCGRAGLLTDVRYLAPLFPHAFRALVLLVQHHVEVWAAVSAKGPSGRAAEAV